MCPFGYARDGYVELVDRTHLLYIVVYDSLKLYLDGLSFVFLSRSCRVEHGVALGARGFLSRNRVLRLHVSERIDLSSFKLKSASQLITCMWIIACE